MRHTVALAVPLSPEAVRLEVALLFLKVSNPQLEFLQIVAALFALVE